MFIPPGFSDLHVFSPLSQKAKIRKTHREEKQPTEPGASNLFVFVGE